MCMRACHETSDFFQHLSWQLVLSATELATSYNQLSCDGIEISITANLLVLHYPQPLCHISAECGATWGKTEVPGLLHNGLLQSAARIINSNAVEDAEHTMLWWL